MKWAEEAIQKYLINISFSHSGGLCGYRFRAFCEYIKCSMELLNFHLSRKGVSLVEILRDGFMSLESIIPTESW